MCGEFARLISRYIVGSPESMRILLPIFLVMVPCVSCATVQLVSAEYVQNIVDSIPKTNQITDDASENELPTASAVLNMGNQIRAEVNAHMEDKENPHNVTAQQVGLENVKNVDTTDATNITSGKFSYDRLPVGMTANTVAAGNDNRFFGVPRTKPNTDAPDGMVWMWFE